MQHFNVYSCLVDNSRAFSSNKFSLIILKAANIELLWLRISPGFILLPYEKIAGKENETPFHQSSLTNCLTL